MSIGREYRKYALYIVLILLVPIVLAACAKQQETIADRNAAIGDNQSSVPSNYFEAQQIQNIEEWKDNPDKIVNVYIFNTVTGGLLIPPVQCQGVPASSTESLEPNVGSPRGFDSGSYWVVPIDGTDVLTNEMAGRDGTFGDPVPFRQCLSVDGHYYDFPALGMPYLVTSASYTFPDATVQRDFETEIRLLQAEALLQAGKCVDMQTLVEVPCE